MGLPSSTLRIAAAACALFALSGGAASAAWSPPRTLASVDGFAPAPALSPDGRATVVVSDYDADGSRILAASRPRGGRWSSPRVVRSSRQELFDPAAAFTNRGDTLVAWIRAPRLDQIQVVEARSLRRDGSLGAVAEISGDRGRPIFPALAAGPDGRAMLAWQDDEYRLTVSEAGDAGFGAPVALFDRRQFASRLALLPGGGAVAVSQAFGPRGVRVAVRPASGSWGEPVVLSGERTAREPALAVAPDGTIAVAWAQNTDQGYRVQYSVRPRGGRFGAPVTAGDGRGPAVAFGADGTLLLAWVAATRDAWLLRGGEVRLAAAPAGGALGKPARFPAPEGRILTAPNLFTDRQGDALLTWTRRIRAGETVSVVRSRSGKVGMPEAIGPGGARVVANAAGDALAVWALPGAHGRAVVQVAERRF